MFNVYISVKYKKIFIENDNQQVVFCNYFCITLNCEKDFKTIGFGNILKIIAFKTK